MISPSSTAASRRGIRYLAAADVRHLLPPFQEQIELVRETYDSMAGGGTQVPATPMIKARPDAFAHAMPAYVAHKDVTSVKWISGYQSNPTVGLPYLNGIIVVNDSETGLPAAIMDCGAITAARTAAASALCIKEFAPKDWSRVGIVGYGVQARAHVEILRYLNPDLDVRVATRDPAAEPSSSGIALVPRVSDAVAGAAVVITGIPLDARLQPPITGSLLAESCLVLPIDYDASIAPSLANEACLFLVDDQPAFDLKRPNGRFRGWRSPDASIADAMRLHPPSGGHVVVCNLGVGALDAVFAHAVLATQADERRGVWLDR